LETSYFEVIKHLKHFLHQTGEWTAVSFIPVAYSSEIHGSYET